MARYEITDESVEGGHVAYADTPADAWFTWQRQVTDALSRKQMSDSAFLRIDTARNLVTESDIATMGNLGRKAAGVKVRRVKDAVCPKHQQDIDAYKGCACGESGWGPGHRLPAGLTMKMVDDQVKVIREICASDKTCGKASDTPRKCASRDH